MASFTTYTLQVNGSDVHVTLKRMKSIRLQVKSTGEVTLSAPTRYQQSPYKRIRSVEG